MKRLLNSAVVFLCFVATSFAQFSGSGSGTENDPYLIFNETQLSQMSNFLNQEGIVFKLMKDLDLTNWISENNPRQGWIPIGVQSTPFKGKFYGNNHIISGLTITRTSANNVGFFGYVSNATISDLTIEGSSIAASQDVGGLVGHIINSSVSNCHVTLTGINGVYGSSNVGGLAGYSNNTNYTTFSVEASVAASENVGGCIGKVEKGVIEDGSVTGTIISQGSYAGGLIGNAANHTLGGINVSSDIVGQDYTGGITGYGSQGILTTCTHRGTLSGNQFVGGIAGSVQGSQGRATSFDSCYSIGKIISTGDNCGGIVGIIKSGSIEEMKNCSHFGDIEGQSYTGGLIGAMPYDVDGISWIPITLLFRNVNNCTAIGNITGLSFVGGLIGSEAPSSTVSLNLINSYFSGTIQGTENVGGLYGHKCYGTIQNSYAYASIFGTSNVGGIVGYISSESDILYSNRKTTIKSNVSNNAVISATTSDVGRIYGKADNTDEVVIGALASAEGNRALTQTRVILSGVIQEVEDDLQNGTSIGPSLLRLKATYVSMGWDFDNNWNILETECYPYKKYQAAPPVIESNLVSQSTIISGKSVDNGTVYLYYKDREAMSTQCNNHQWAFNIEPLQSGAQVQIYTDVEGMTPSYFTTSIVGYPGSGTESDPWRIYTAEDLQGTNNRGYYKVMNDIDLTSWINQNSPTEGWPAIGRDSGEATYIDGDGHKISGLWTNTAQNYTGLFSNFSAGQIKNLKVEVATGRKVKGGDYTGILIGRNAQGSIVNCSVTGDVEGMTHTGGVVGYIEASKISNVTYEGSVSSSGDESFVGGIAGQAKTCSVNDCISTANISTIGANSRVGGLIGDAKEGSISRCFVSTTLEATGTSNTVGGLVGYSMTPITLSVSTGNVSATGNNSYTGGLVGYALSPVSNSYSTAKTTGTLYSAGLIGYTFSTIDKCYATGNIYGDMYGAGLVGELDGQGARLTNSVACNNILELTAQSSWGCRVIGGFKNGAEDPDQSNYALKTMQVSLNGVPQVKTDDLVEGVAKTKLELMTATTYQGIGWDFDTIWQIEEGLGYPYLQGSSTVGPTPPDNEDDFIDTDISALDNVIYVERAETAPGNELILSIKMKNSAAIRGFQFNLSLPDGVTIAKNNNGKVLASLSDGRLPEDDQHTLTVNEQSDGSYLFLCGSLYEETFTGNEGEIATVKVNVYLGMEDGKYPITLKNIKLTESDISKYYEIREVKSTLAITSCIIGDINGDWKVDISDYIGIANRILGYAQEGFNEKAGDVNSDGFIDVSDYIGVANIILTGSIYGSQQHASSRLQSADATGLITDENVIYVAPQSVISGEIVMLSICMNNTAPIRGFQFDLYLPEGVIAAKNTNGRFICSLNNNRLEADDEHTLTLAEQQDGGFRFLCGSQYDENFIGNEGEIATLMVRVDEKMPYGSYPIVLRNMKLSESNINNFYETESIETYLTIDSPDCIYGMESKTQLRQEFYLLSGQRVQKPIKGVNIISGKKVLVR